MPLEYVGTQGKEVLRPSLELLRRIFNRLIVVGDCWIFTGARSSRGYGVIKHEGKLLRVHRAMFAAFYGTLPAGYDVHHSCHKPLCVNPTHLSLLSRGANVTESNHERNQPKHRPGDTDGLCGVVNEDVEKGMCPHCRGCGWTERSINKLCGKVGRHNVVVPAKDTEANEVPF